MSFFTCKFCGCLGRLTSLTFNITTLLTSCVTQLFLALWVCVYAILRLSTPKIESKFEPMSVNQIFWFRVFRYFSPGYVLVIFLRLIDGTYFVSENVTIGGLEENGPAGMDKASEKIICAKRTIARLEHCHRAQIRNSGQ